MKIRNSFTLIEILIVVGILMVLSAATIPSFVNYSKERSIDRLTQEIVNEIQLVRNKALSGAYEVKDGVPSLRWLIRFRCDTGGNDRYILGFTSDDGTTLKVAAGKHIFSEGFDIIDIDSYNDCRLIGSLNWNEFIFDRLTGELFNPVDTTSGSRMLRISNGSSTRTITVFRSGAITVSNP